MSQIALDYNVTQGELIEANPWLVKNGRTEDDLYANKDVLVLPDSGFALDRNSSKFCIECALKLENDHKYNVCQEKAGLYVVARDLNTYKTLGAGKHQFLVLIPENPAQINDLIEEHYPDAKLEDFGDGTFGIVVGAHDVDGRLQVKFSEEADLQSIKEHMDYGDDRDWTPDFDAQIERVDANESKKTNDELIKDALRLAGIYKKNESQEDYAYQGPDAGSFIHEKLSSCVNSNSWAQTMVEGLVGPGKVLEDFDGADKCASNRVDDKYFTE